MIFNAADDPTVNDAFRAVCTQLTTPKYGKMFKPKVMHWYDGVDVDKDSVFQNTDFVSDTIPTLKDCAVTPDRTKMVIHTGSVLYLYALSASEDITLITTFNLPVTTDIEEFTLLAVDDDGALLVGWYSAKVYSVQYADFASKTLKTATASTATESYWPNKVANKQNSALGLWCSNVTDSKYMFSYSNYNNYPLSRFDKETLELTTVFSNILGATVYQTTGGVVTTYASTSSPYDISLRYVVRNATPRDSSSSSEPAINMTLLTGSKSNTLGMFVISDYIFVKLYTSSGSTTECRMYRFSSEDTEPVLYRTITEEVYDLLSNYVCFDGLLYDASSMYYNIDQRVFSLADAQESGKNDNYAVVPYFGSQLSLSRMTSSNGYSLIVPLVDLKYLCGYIIPGTHIAIMQNTGICYFDDFEYL